MKNILLIFATFSIMTASFGQTKELDSQFFSTFQKYLDNAEGLKINFKKGEIHKIGQQLFTADTIRIHEESDYGSWGIVHVEEIFDIKWDYDQNYTYFVRPDHENEKLVSFALGFLSEYSQYFYSIGNETKGELYKSKRVTFRIRKKDFYQFREFLESYGIYGRLIW